MQLSIFDLDRTLLTVNTSFKYYSYLRKKGFFSFYSFFFASFYFFLYFFFLISPEKLHYLAFNRFLRNKKAFFLNDITAFLADLKQYHYLPAMRSLEMAKQNGHFILILSSSPSFLVKEIARDLNADGFGASEYLIDENNTFKEITTLMDGQEKAKNALLIAKKLNVSRENIWVYSDSIWDLPLFEIAEHRVAVNPDKRLCSFFKKNNWLII